MRFPVDATKIQLICCGESELSLAFESEEQRTNSKGEPLFQIQLLAGGSERPILINVRTPVEPKGIAFGVPVRAVGLCLIPWSSRNTTGGGVNYEADRVEALRGAST
jgi:hypothetical protein